MPGAAAVRWLDGNRVEVDGFTFLVTDDRRLYSSTASTPEQFLLVKSTVYLKGCVDKFAALAPGNVVEIGVYQGGSAAFWNLVLRPRKHLVFDLYDRDVEVLADFAAGPASSDGFQVRFGVDQADDRALSAVVAETFGDEPLDLVIDDGSHAYAETRAAFEVLFPRLRHGGVYVIEDWAWAHRPDQGSIVELSCDRPALSNLIVELMMVCGSATDVVDEITIEPEAACVVRGPRQFDSPFRIAAEYFNRSLRFRPLL